MKANPPQRRMPIGAEPGPDGNTHFRVWAPDAQRVQVRLGDRLAPLEREEGGYHAGWVAEAGPGARYRYQLGDGPDAYPDPASRFQPEGPHGPSEVIDPDLFHWTDAAWPGVRLEGQVLYEMHIGTFTREGTWNAAMDHLPRLADIGVTVLEVMPVADFAGSYNWGYDGVNLFAPTRVYGQPGDFRAFVDRAHALGLGVILDVVYNHFGPDGNYIRNFSEHYFSKRHMTDWGEGINYEAPQVREFMCSNAAFWIREYHLDGLRFDATQDIHDDSTEHILALIGRSARKAAGCRTIILVAENEPQDVRLVKPAEQGGCGLDALWNDDFHHAARVRLTGSRSAYYADYRGSPQEFVSTLKHGYLFQGQYYAWQKKGRGTPAFDISPASFVTYLENHDQIANSPLALRLSCVASPRILRGITALWLLGPGTPMLFQGQEWGARNPFYYFTDHKKELGDLIRKGRQAFMDQFSIMKDPGMKDKLPDPGSREIFEKSCLDESARVEESVALHKDLLSLRRKDPAFRQQRRQAVDGAVLGSQAFVIRFFELEGNDRLLLVNFGEDLSLNSVPEPLMAPPVGKSWKLVWSSENPRYGGSGTPPLDFVRSPILVPGQAAVVLG